MIRTFVTAIIMITASVVANAAPMQTSHFKNHVSEYNRGYNYGYARGEYHAKQEIQERIYKTATVAGVAVIASVIIYQWGKNSNWTVSQNGVGYRF